MPITTSAIGLNCAIGIGVWMSSLTTFTKIVLTGVLVVKFLIFFISVWIIDEEKIRKVGTTVCIFLNIVLVIYGVLVSEYYIALSTAILLVALSVWSFAAIYDFRLRR